MPTNDVRPTSLERKRVIVKTLQWLLSFLVAITLVIILIFVVVISKATNKNTNTLVDCTTPKHACYEQARSATTGAVGTINRVTVLAVACAAVPGNNTLDKIQQCVNEGLKG